MSGSPRTPESWVYRVFLTIAVALTLTGFLAVILVVRRIVDYSAVADIGLWSLLGMIVLVGAFLLSRALARRGRSQIVPAKGKPRKLLLIVAVAGLVTGLLATNYPRFGEPGAWTEGRVVAEAGEFWAYSPSARVRATAADYEMEQRVVQLVPLAFSVFVAGLFQAYLAIDAVVPGVILRVLLTPWRLVRQRKPDAHEALDAYNSWD